MQASVAVVWFCKSVYMCACMSLWVWWLRICKIMLIIEQMYMLYPQHIKYKLKKGLVVLL